MQEKDISIFIEEMKDIGDEWTPEQVKDVYGHLALEDALNDRKSLINAFWGNFGKIYNGK